jgi:hypothetical protein
MTVPDHLPTRFRVLVRSISGPYDLSTKVQYKLKIKFPGSDEEFDASLDVPIERFGLIHVGDILAIEWQYQGNYMAHENTLKW